MLLLLRTTGYFKTAFSRYPFLMPVTVEMNESGINLRNG